MKLVIILIQICFFVLPVQAKHLYLERDYQDVWCKANNGITEYRLSDNCRVDCLTNTHAIEFDFAEKWAESIGQALYYGLQTNKTPGVVLIIEDPEKDIKYVRRLIRVACCNGIDYWFMYVSDICKCK